jgi:hypothetical protein
MTGITFAKIARRKRLVRTLQIILMLVKKPGNPLLQLICPTPFPHRDGVLKEASLDLRR